MPIYAYRCAACGHDHEALQKISDAPLTICPACGVAALQKQVTAAGFQLKGSGWYVTDFRNNGGAAAKAADKADKADKGDKADGAAPATDSKPSAGDSGASAASPSTSAGAAAPTAAPSPAPAAAAPTPPSAA